MCGRRFSSLPCPSSSFSKPRGGPKAPKIFSHPAVPAVVDAPVFHGPHVRKRHANLGTDMYAAWRRGNCVVALSDGVATVVFSSAKFFYYAQSASRPFRPAKMCLRPYRFQCLRS